VVVEAGRGFGGGAGRNGGSAAAGAGFRPEEINRAPRSGRAPRAAGRRSHAGGIAARGGSARARSCRCSSSVRARAPALRPGAARQQQQLFVGEMRLQFAREQARQFRASFRVDAGSRAASRARRASTSARGGVRPSAKSIPGCVSYDARLSFGGRAEARAPACACRLATGAARTAPGTAPPREHQITRTRIQTMFSMNGEWITSASARTTCLC